MREIADYALEIPSTRTPRIQEGCLAAGHAICGLVERGVYGKKAVFIDRDDTIAPDVPYCPSPDRFEFFPGVPGEIAKLNAAGYLVVVVTNQSGLARGKFSESDLDAVHAKMRALVEAGGGRIDGVYHCPHHPDDGCGCRKPEIGMGYDAVYELGIDPRKSFMVGNSDSDVEFGKRLGCRESIKVEGPGGFAEAVSRILGS
ncbi:MAG: HAD-IIIA family hydrolase [Thermoplasmatales archaeon]|nr:HAD-IIIA family hydrolase [Thermoplasmatales archaeon]